jgi:hypothetical protein
MEKRKITGAVALIIIYLFYSCSTAPIVKKEQENLSNAFQPVQEKLVEAAYWAEGRNSLKVRGKSFELDCTGIVLAVYYYAGIDLAKDFYKYEGNGVKRIYLYLKNNTLLYKTRHPAPGDLIFWNNTWDANDNGSADDKLTHVGMMVSMDQASGQGTYLHYNYAKGITIEKINLLDPDNPALNAPYACVPCPG